jgi:hypothetical protein
MITKRKEASLTLWGSKICLDRGVYLTLVDVEATQPTNLQEDDAGCSNNASPFRAKRLGAGSVVASGIMPGRNTSRVA